MMCTATSAPGEVASFAAFFDDGELLVVPISAAQLPVRLKAYPWQKQSNTLWLEFLEEMDPLSTDRRDLVLVVHFIISEANCPTAVGERSRICAMRCITVGQKLSDCPQDPQGTGLEIHDEIRPETRNY